MTQTLLTTAILLLLAQAPPGGGAVVRYQITLEFHGVWGLLTDQSGTCPGVPPGYDRFTGVVSGVEPPRSGTHGAPTGTKSSPSPMAAPPAPCTGIPCQSATNPPPPADEDDGPDAVEYEGVLSRESEVGLCETKDTASGTEWCSGHLSGKGPFKVTIKVPLVGNDSEQTRIAFEPDPTRIMAVTASVNGACDSLDNAALAADYRSQNAIYFETIDASGLPLMPTGGLTRGTFLQTRHSQPGDAGGYTLTVQPVP